ncbi:phenylalanine--tRNA ligase beta subunit-related protein [uncultured Cardiobacterium sp.]|uniref:B3/B4 domain-containing protein n=1 Tax=uncultured Cardiobacterium sp. TaxID=417619 RepID=UPI0026269D62|nr:phenylalanine--tRNA ligase beta subunit-related protein [uncultured Cardiobacterium sp.]
MKFTVAPEIFAALPGLYIGVVVADGVDNATARPAIEAQLHTAITAAAARWQGVKIREAPAIAPYRAAFQALGINPNKYSCSIEALLSRIGKGKGLPAINPLVDLNNAISLEHTLPMGTHDLGGADDDITLRPARAGDVFLPFGGGATETPDVGEAVYAVGQQIRTRRWTWRQSEHGKITAATRRVFFPIDGFAGSNDEQVRRAVAALVAALRTHFDVAARHGIVDREHPHLAID